MDIRAPSPSSQPGRRRTFSYRSLPVWLQWAVPFTVAIVVVLGIVLYTHYETYDVNQQVDNYNSPAAQVQENQQAAIIVAQQQAPHVFKLRAGVGLDANARRAVVAYMDRQITLGLMDGPINHAGCAAAGGTASRVVLHCDVVASVVKYPFDVVVQPAAGTVTYCQRVAPPVPTMSVPVSGRCT